MKMNAKHGFHLTLETHLIILIIKKKQKNPQPQRWVVI